MTKTGQPQNNTDYQQHSEQIQDNIKWKAMQQFIHDIEKDIGQESGLRHRMSKAQDPDELVTIMLPKRRRQHTDLIQKHMGKLARMANHDRDHLGTRR